MESMPRSANSCSRRSRIARTSATVRRTRSASSRVATPPTCGSPASAAERAAAEVEAVELHLARGVRSARASDQRAQQGASCRSAGRRRRRRGPPPRTGRPPAGRGAARTAGRRCPTGTRAAGRATRQPSAVQAAQRGSVRQRRQQLVERRRLVQRRQPDLVGRRALPRPAGRISDRRAGSGPASPGWSPSSAGAGGCAAGLRRHRGLDVPGAVRHDHRPDLPRRRRGARRGVRLAAGTARTRRRP